MTYKGALQGQGAHTVWIGNVLIRQVAEGIETYEENRNLVLTEGCQADSVPNLEIETGEIEGAGHASTTARFDDEQLFYLRSRGVSDAEASRLVLHGFFNDLIRRVGVPSLEERLTTTVEAELAKNVSGRRPMAFERACAPPTSRRRGAARHGGRRRRRDRPLHGEQGEASSPCTTCARTPRSPSARARWSDCTIECWLHGSRFDLRTGKPTGLPATAPIATFPVEVRDRLTDGIYVDTTTTLNGVTPS